MNHAHSIGSRLFHRARLVIGGIGWSRSSFISIAAVLIRSLSPEYAFNIMPPLFSGANSSDFGASSEAFEGTTHAHQPEQVIDVHVYFIEYMPDENAEKGRQARTAQATIPIIVPENADVWWGSRNVE